MLFVTMQSLDNIPLWLNHMLVREYIFKKNQILYVIQWDKYLTELRSLAQHHILILMGAQTTTEPQKIYARKKKKNKKGRAL